MRPRFLVIVLGIAFAAVGSCAARGTASAVVASQTNRPAWLVLRPGTIARVDIGLWATADEPEASLTESVASLAGDLSADTARPGDVVYEPVGVRVRVVRVVPGTHVAIVHGIDRRFQAYARIERLIPEIPPGTHLRAAGGFGGFADFYPTLATRQATAQRIATGSDLVALAMGTAPFDPGSADLVRVRVRALSGNLRGRTGWIAVAYTGLPSADPGNAAQPEERACRCRLVQFPTSP